MTTVINPFDRFREASEQFDNRPLNVISFKSALKIFVPLLCHFEMSFCIIQIVAANNILFRATYASLGLRDINTERLEQMIAEAPAQVNGLERALKCSGMSMNAHEYFR